MQLQRFALCFAAFAPAAFSQAPAAASAPGAAQEAPASIFGQPVVVNGRRITDEDIKRFLIYGPCRLMLENERVRLIIDEELGRRARDAASAAIEPEVSKRAKTLASAAVEKQSFTTPEDRQKALDAETGKARAAVMEQADIREAWNAEAKKQRQALDLSVQPNEDEYQSEYKRTLEEFRENYPVLNVEAEVSRAFRTLPWYAEHLRLTMLFDNTFYPPNPADWPITTLESVRADSGDVLVNDAFESYRMRKEHADKTGEPLTKEDGVYTQMMRQIVRDAMFNTVDFKTAYDGLPPDLVLTGDVDGDGKPELVIKTEDMWKKVSDTVAQTEIDEAKQWYVTYWSTHDRLQKDGGLLGIDERKAAISKLLKTFEGTYFNLDILATQTHFFPSTEAYKDYYTLMEGFRKIKEPALKKAENGDLPPELRQYLPTANNIMGLGQVDVEIMLVSAFDIPNFKWKPDGWAWAKKQAEEVKAKIDANLAEYNAERAKAAQAKAEGKEYKAEKEVMEPYRYWSQMMDDHSEYWDPPSPEQGRGSDVAMKKRGRFGMRYRNDLQGFVGETPYRHWVTGDSLTDYTFSTQAEGTVAGPFKGPMGWYLTRVQRRTPPTRPLDLGNEKHVEFLREDYLRVAFVEYAREARKQAEYSGVEKF